MPATYIWCAQTKNPTTEILKIARTIPKCPDTEARNHLDIVKLTRPNAGRIIT
jgi:hypothetical protein